MPTYFELFALGATLFSFKDNQNNNVQKKGRSMKKKNEIWNAVGVVILGEAGFSDQQVKTYNEIMSNHNSSRWVRVPRRPLYLKEKPLTVFCSGFFC